MTTIFTWSITEMQVRADVDNLKNFVSIVNWELTGDDGVNTSSVVSAFGFKPDDTINYTPYEELTQDQVIGWVKDRLGANGISHFEGIVQSQLDNVTTPSVTPEPKPLPWVTA